MIFYDAIPCRGFLVCYGAVSPNQTHDPQSTLTNRYSEWGYIETGELTCEGNGQSVVLASGQLTNLSQFKGHSTTLTAGDVPVMFAAFNPMREGTMNCVLLDSNTEVSGEACVFVLNGGMGVDNKTVPAWKYLYVREGETKTVALANGAKAVKVTFN